MHRMVMLLCFVVGLMAHQAAMAQIQQERYFIAAMKQTDEGVKVRLVDRERMRAYWMGVGEKLGDVGIVAADYSNEVVFVQTGARMLCFSLAGEPQVTDVLELSPEHLAYWVNQDNEPAATSGTAPEGTPWTPDEEKLKDPSDATHRTYAPPRRYAAGIEEILRDHPQLRKELNIKINPTPAPSVEEMLKRFPEAREWLKTTREPEESAVQEQELDLEQLP